MFVRSITPEVVDDPPTGFIVLWTEQLLGYPAWRLFEDYRIRTDRVEDVHIDLKEIWIEFDLTGVRDRMAALNIYAKDFIYHLEPDDAPRQPFDIEGHE